MDSLTTAEAVTRLLRGKNTPVTQACAVSRALLAHEVPVFLPNASHFVFELVCDRMGDLTGKFQGWKLHADIWKLWILLWRDLGVSAAGKETRAVAFRRVKFVAVMLAVLALGPGAATLDAMFECVDELRATGFIDVDEYTAVGLFESYVGLLQGERGEEGKDGKEEGQHRKKEKKKERKQKGKTAPSSSTPFPSTPFPSPSFSSSSLVHWSVSVAAVVTLARTAHRPTKKSQARFFAHVVPPLADILARDILPPQAAAPLHALLVPAAFGPDTAPHLAPHLAAASLTPAAARFLFRLTVAHVARDMTVCEAVFRALTTGVLAPLAEPLLAQLAAVNRALLPQFFLDLYAAETEKPAPDWRLVGHLVRLDPALALAQWQQVIAAPTLAAADAPVVAADLARGFMLAREWPRFLAEVYPAALTHAPLWGAPEVVAQLAPLVRDLSPLQAAALARTYVDARARGPLALLLQGLLQSAPAVRAACLPVMASAPLPWADVAYLALCVYGDQIAVGSHNEPLKNVSVVTDDLSTVVLHLRAAELSGDVSAVSDADVETHICALAPRAVADFARRWLVLLDHLPRARTALVRRLLALCPPDLLAFVDTHAVVLFERRALMQEILAHAAAYPELDLLFAKIPPAVFRRFFAAHIPALWDRAATNTTAARALHHVLRPATLASAPERDFASLRRLVRPNCADAVATARHVWAAHLRSFSDTPSARYVLSALDTMNAALDNPTPADRALAGVIVALAGVADEAYTAGHGAVCAKFVAQVVAAAAAHADARAAVTELAQLPPRVPDVARDSVRAAIRDLGARATDSHSRALLFALVARVARPRDAKYVTALYVALAEANPTVEPEIPSDAPDLPLTALSAYFATLDADQFDTVFRHVLASTTTASPFVGPLVDVLARLLPLLSKDHAPTHARLFVAAISAVALHPASEIPVLSALRFVRAATAMLSDHIWACSQYAVESLLVWGAAVSVRPEVYTAAVNLVAHVVLFHRFRLSSRYHLVVGTALRMMAPLGRALPLDAAAYARLLSALCDPPTQALARDADALTSEANVYKKAVRRHAHVLLVNYIHAQLAAPMPGPVTAALMPGIYSVFGLLSAAELNLVNQCLDSLGKAYYRTLYSGYKDHGKWKDS